MPRNSDYYTDHPQNGEPTREMSVEQALAQSRRAAAQNQAIDNAQVPYSPMEPGLKPSDFAAARNTR